MNFKSARDCFKKAWRLNQNEESLKSLLWVSKLLGDETSFFDAVENSSMDEEEIQTVVDEFDHVQADSKTDKNDKMKAVREMFNEQSSQGFKAKRDSYLAGLKEWYRS